MPDPASHDPTAALEAITDSPPERFWKTEDGWAVGIAACILAVSFLAVWAGRPADSHQTLASIRQAESELDAIYQHGDLTAEPSAESVAKRLTSLAAAYAPNPLASYLAKPSKWRDSPLEALRQTSAEDPTRSLLPAILCTGLVSCLLFGTAQWVMGRSPVHFALGFCGVFLLTLCSFVIASHSIIKDLNLEYPLWALLIGLLIANTIGTPKWIAPAVQTEFYIKTGLVLLGAKILLGQLLALGVPGICVSWIVTPAVLVLTYWFGQSILRIGSKSLNMTISADMSVCGVSAAIATAAACKAKKEELSIAISLSLMFTVIMMFVMPLVIRLCGMSEVLGGAWMGGTIDATGAVAAAGKFLGPKAETVAVTIKMIQNILIGVIAFFVALYWVTIVERSVDQPRPSPWVIWQRFPKFVLGFVAASLTFSWIAFSVAGGELMIDSMVRGATDVFRSWFFCLAFVCIGLDTNFRALAVHFHGGKPLVLYVAGQALNLVLTLVMAWLMFEVVFPQVAEQL